MLRELKEEDQEPEASNILQEKSAPGIWYTPNRYSSTINAKHVSSQGCSRLFIIIVLRILREHVLGNKVPSIVMIDRSLVTNWFLMAKLRCSDTTISAPLETKYGGPPFRAEDSRTFWTDPSQLFCWWKNNVERRSKVKAPLS